MYSKDVSSMPALRVAHQFLVGISVERINPLNSGYGWGKLVVISDGIKRGRRGRASHEVATSKIRVTREQYERLDLRMAHRNLDRIVNPTAGAADSDDVATDPRLRPEVGKSRVNVAGEFLLHNLARLLGCELVEVFATAFAKTSVVQG